MQTLKNNDWNADFFFLSWCQTPFFHCAQNYKNWPLFSCISYTHVCRMRGKFSFSSVGGSRDYRMLVWTDQERTAVSVAMPPTWLVLATVHLWKCLIWYSVTLLGRKEFNACSLSATSHHSYNPRRVKCDPGLLPVLLKKSTLPIKYVYKHGLEIWNMYVHQQSGTVFYSRTSPIISCEACD